MNIRFPFASEYVGDPVEVALAKEVEYERITIPDPPLRPLPSAPPPPRWDEGRKEVTDNHHLPRRGIRLARIFRNVGRIIR